MWISVFHLFASDETIFSVGICRRKGRVLKSIDTTEMKKTTKQNKQFRKEKKKSLLKNQLKRYINIKFR